METLSLDTGRRFIRELSDGQKVDECFAVRELQRRQKKNGEAFLKLRLGDSTGTVEAVVWDEVDQIAAQCAGGAVIRVAGTFTVDQKYGPSLRVRELRAAEAGEYDLGDLEDGPSAPVEQMESDLRALVATVQDPHMRALLDRVFAPCSKSWERWSQAPAAKTNHEAYRHGLLEHTLSVAEGVSALAAKHQEVDRDLAVTGALLHDIGKVEVYAMEGGAIEFTDRGKLHGEIPLGYYRVRRTIEELPGFPPDTAEGLLHIILSHHGQLEHGSPVVPCTREATLVHMVDNLGSKLGSFARIEKGLGDGEKWSSFDRALSGSAYFGSRAA